jgi:predicted DsbA family dithiol-disulfide isomerase
VRVEIWSDVVCPWCFIGKRHFEQALERFEHRDDVEVTWRSFELDPGHPGSRDGDLSQALADKYGTSREQARAMIDGMIERAATVGLRYDLHRAVPANTFDAHRLIHLAATRGLQDSAEERLFTAHMAEGADVGDHRTLVRLAGEIGLDEAGAEAMLAGGEYGDAVREDERRAAQIGVSGVPFFVIDGAFGISGAQPPELILSGLRQAHAARAERVAATAGAAAGDEGSR